MTTSNPWLEQATAQIAQANSSKTPLRIQGHGSKSFYGEPANENHALLSTLDYSGVVEYDPTELVVVVKSGTPIHDLEKTLVESRQMLAFEPPRFAGKGTVGGMVATGLSGPRRMSAGAVKDFVLGMTVLDPQATPLRYGGTVMKNVAGYDLARLHTGALGTLGLIVDVSLKVLPLPPAEETIVFDATAQQSLAWANEWGGKPLPISATCWLDGSFHVRLSGAVAAVKSAKEKLGGTALGQPEANEFWQSLRDQAHGFFQLAPKESDQCLWRLSVPGTTPDFAEIEAPQCIEWGGALRWVKTNAPAERLRAIAAKAGGHATLFRSHSPEIRDAHSAFTQPSPAIMKIHQRLKQELDPNRIFNPGRLYAGL
jgi:glycolate oxidase FAD binding subunit